MTMTITQQIITVVVVVLGTMTTRFLPFIIFPEEKEPPAVITYLGKVLPWEFEGYTRSRDYKYGKILLTIYRKA